MGFANDMIWLLLLIPAAGIIWILHMRTVRYPPVHDTITQPSLLVAVLLMAMFAFGHFLDILFVGSPLLVLVVIVGAIIGPATFYVLNGMYDRSPPIAREVTVLKVYATSAEGQGCERPFHSNYEAVVESWVPG